MIKSTSGTDRPEAANQALTVAAAGVAAGVDVSLWPVSYTHLTLPTIRLV